MIKVDQIRVPVWHENDEKEAALLACTKKLGVDAADISAFKLLKRSIDARKKPDEVFFVYSASMKIKSGSRYRKKDTAEYIRREYNMPAMHSASLNDRPVVIGMGPAGLFAGLILARCGLRPIILERGKSVEDRKKDVDAFFEGGRLDPESNVLFGEGGAGTFSDGKLSSQVKDKEGRIDFILKTFADHGAPEEIQYEYKPHVGTDVLYDVVRNIRNEIISLGGEVRFETLVSGLITDGDRITGLELSGGEKLEACRVILAIGHSARDTFESLHAAKVAMQAKEFAVGLRVEHDQDMINETQYGIKAAKILPAASYKLTHKSASERGVYSFCMCPGGYVVNSSSEEGMLCVNGMSYSRRDSGNANSAIIVSVGRGEYDMSDALAGIAFQRKLEKKAFDLCSGAVPQQLFGDFLRKEKSSGYGSITSRLKGTGELTDLSPLFSKDIYDSFCEGMMAFDKKIKGFGAHDTILSGVESRTSSPVRIPRDESFMANYKGLFPCGEGAGYAGGILSAAIDGMKCAEALIRDYDNADRS